VIRAEGKGHCFRSQGRQDLGLLSLDIVRTSTSPNLLARLATVHRAILSRTLRNGRICQSMAGFWGGTDFVSEMSSEILRIDSVTLTHRSASYEKRPHLLTPISAVDTCGRWLRSTDFQDVVHVRYAISCVSRARRCFGYFAIFHEMSRQRGWMLACEADSN
jgi:hypothetical protein